MESVLLGKPSVGISGCSDFSDDRNGNDSGGGDDDCDGLKMKCLFPTGSYTGGLFDNWWSQEMVAP
jgi:hypothetical protein